MLPYRTGAVTVATVLLIFIPAFGNGDLETWIVDTDAGTDDAMALAMALAAHRRGEIRLAAVTTAAGNVGVADVTANVALVLEAAGVADVPVYRGSDRLYGGSDFDPADFPSYAGEDGFNGAAAACGRPDLAAVVRPGKTAAEAIRDVVLGNKEGGGVTLVTLGPLTNVALAMDLSPSLPSSLGRLVVMGGSLRNHSGERAPELNFMVDPEAARRVVEGAVGRTAVTLVPEEACLDLGDLIGPPDSIFRPDDPMGSLMLKLPDARPGNRKVWAVFDQVAVAVALNPECIGKSKEEKVEVSVSPVPGVLVPVVAGGGGVAVVVTRADGGCVLGEIERAFS